MALRDFFWRGRGKGGRCRRERSVSRVPGGMLRPMPIDSRCRSSARHGRLRALVFAGLKEQSGRTELMPRFTEACVESGSGRLYRRNRLHYLLWAELNWRIER